MDVIFLLAGLLSLVVGGAIIYSGLIVRRGTQPVRGEVVGFTAGQGNRPGSPSFHSVAKFAGPDGVTRYIESALGSSTPMHKVGEPVTIRVNPLEPQKAAFQSGFAFIIGSFVALMGLVGILVFHFTFQVTLFSMIGAAVVFFTIAAKVKAVLNQTGVLPTRIFDEQSRDKIVWADPLAVSSSVDGTRKAKYFTIPILFALGTAGLFSSYYFYEKTQAFLEKAIGTAGRVVELKAIQSKNSHTWAPVIEFTDNQGHRAKFVESFSSSPPAYHVGESVNILYNRENPGDARIDRGRANQWAAFVFGSLGALFTLLGALSLR